MSYLPTFGKLELWIFGRKIRVEYVELAIGFKHRIQVPLPGITAAATKNPGREPQVSGEPGGGGRRHACTRELGEEHGRQV